MEFLEYLQDKWNLDPVIILLVILSGFFQAKYLVVFKLAKDTKYDQAVKTLLVSFVVSIIWIFLSKTENEPIPFAKYFISYFAATSLYELLIKPVTKHFVGLSEK